VKYFIVLGVSLFFLSCGPQGNGVPGAQESAPAPVVAASSIEAYVLIHDLAMWKEEGGLLKWVMNLSVADRVKLSDQSGKFKTEGSDTERDYVKVVYGDKEGWVRPIFLAAKATLGVVITEKAKIYSEPRDIKVTSKFLSGKTLVAVFNEGGEGDFFKVAAYDYSQKTLFTDNTFISKSDITMQDADINAITLYIAASQAKTPELKLNLLSMAVEKYRDSFFAPELTNELAAMKGEEPEAMEPAPATDE